MVILSVQGYYEDPSERHPCAIRKLPEPTLIFACAAGSGKDPWLHVKQA
jgi:hypothetical protein